ncbi:MAG: phosphopyruvate hydratase [Candidatus Altiarchaeota archaeon]
MDFQIKKIKAREILDSRGNPTVEVEIRTEKNFAIADVPSGASTGIHEAVELRDKDDRFNGRGVLKAVKNVNDVIAKKIVGLDCRNQEEIDNLLIELDGTENKSNLGANAILSVSTATVKIAAIEQGVPLYKYIGALANNEIFSLPIPAMNIINGGKHAGNSLDFQEYMIIPIEEENFRERIRICVEAYQNLKEFIVERYGKTAINVGDEGGFAPPMRKIDEPLELITHVLEDLGYEDKIKLGLDCAASEFFNEGKYLVEGNSLWPQELIEKYRLLLDQYCIISFEDPFAQDDWQSWIEFNKKFGKEINIIGDDLLVTNVSRIEKAIHMKACNSLLLKINQIGTISEAIRAFKIAKENNWQVMVSHRSGETEDSFIADFCVGLGAKFIKAGAPCRGERTAKYNQLLRIFDETYGK